MQAPCSFGDNDPAGELRTADAFIRDKQPH